MDASSMYHCSEQL